MANKQQQRKSRNGAGRKPRGNGGGMSGLGPMCSLPAPGSKAYHFERVVAPATLATSASDTGRSFTYTLGSFPGASEFTALFDLYRMTSLEVTFSMNALASTQFYPVLHMLADYDTFTTPATFDVVLQRPHKRVVLTPMAPSYTFKFKPRVLSVVSTSSGTSASALAPLGTYYDCNDSTIVFGGLLGWIENYNTVTGTVLSVTVRGQFDFAMVR